MTIMNTEPVRILVVDDNEKTAQDMRSQLMNLTFASFYVDTANSVAQAKAVLQGMGADFYDLLIVDFGLPDGNGFAILDYLNTMKFKADFRLFSTRSELAYPNKLEYHAAAANSWPPTEIL